MDILLLFYDLPGMEFSHLKFLCWMIKWQEFFTLVINGQSVSISNECLLVVGFFLPFNSFFLLLLLVSRCAANRTQYTDKRVDGFCFSIGFCNEHIGLISSTHKKINIYQFKTCKCLPIIIGLVDICNIFLASFFSPYSVHR